jgi:hypothetical protein
LLQVLGRRSISRGWGGWSISQDNGIIVFGFDNWKVWWGVGTLGAITSCVSILCWVLLFLILI